MRKCDKTRLKVELRVSIEIIEITFMKWETTVSMMCNDNFSTSFYYPK